MAGPDEEIAFVETDPALVLDRMGQRSAAEAGWINFSPEVEEDAVVPPSGGFLSFLAARGPSIPLATWSTGAPTRHGPGRQSLGLQHGGGPRALAALSELGLGLRPGWLKVQDHPRRGLVVTVPPGADHGDLLHWLLSAAHALSTVPLTGDWLARIYTGSR